MRVSRVVPIVIILALVAALLYLLQQPRLKREDLLLLPDILDDRVFLSWGNQGELGESLQKSYEFAQQTEIQKHLPGWKTLVKEFEFSFGFFNSVSDNLEQVIHDESGGKLTIYPPLKPGGGESKDSADPIDVSYVRIREVEYCVYGATLYKTAGTTDRSDDSSWELKAVIGEDPTTTRFRIQAIQRISS